MNGIYMFESRSRLFKIFKDKITIHLPFVNPISTKPYVLEIFVCVKKKKSMAYDRVYHSFY